MDWNSSALWGIIGLIGGFIISFIFYKISNKNKKIIYTKNSQTLITNNLSEIDGLNITYKSQPIMNLTSTTVIIKSIGKDIISMNDFGKATPFCITTTGKFLLQDDIISTITQNSNPNNLINLIVKDDSTILIDFDYLSQGDEITFVFLHTEKINVEGKLKTGVISSNNVFQNASNIIDIISFLTGIAFVIAGNILLLNNFSQFEAIRNTSTFIFNLLLGIILITYCKKVFKRSNNIEINLKDSDNASIRF